MPHLRGIEEGSFDAIGFVLASECGNVVINLALLTMDECAAIAGKAIDDGFDLMQNDKDDK